MTHISSDGFSSKVKRNFQKLTESGAVTVIVPCYNASATLHRAVASILAQSLLPAEVLLVDDASTDNTAAIIRQLEQSYPDVIKGIFLPVNSGPSYARNMAWDTADGEFVAFLDADDVWHPQKLEIQINWLREHPEIAMCGHQCIQYSGREIQLPSGDIKVSKLDLWDMLVSNRFSTPAVILRRNLGQRFPITRKHAEDYELWLRVAAEIGPLYRIELPLAWYFKSAYGASGLSADMWKMEAGELAAIFELRKLGHISMATQSIIIMLSLMKYSKRFIVSVISKLFRSRLQ